MTFTVFLCAWKLLSYIATDSISPVGNGHRKLFVEEKTNRFVEKKKKKRHVIRYTGSETTEKHAFSPSASVSNSLKTDGQVTASFTKTSLWVPRRYKRRTYLVLGDPESGLLLLLSWAQERGGQLPPPLGLLPWSQWSAALFLQTDPCFQRLNFLPVRPCLSPSTLRAQPRETVAGNREVLSPRDHSPKGVGRLKTRLPPCLSFS